LREKYAHCTTRMRFFIFRSENAQVPFRTIFTERPLLYVTSPELSTSSSSSSPHNDGRHPRI